MSGLMSRIATGVSTEKRSKGPIVEKRTLTALRIPPAQLKEIKARAGRHRLTFTEYMIRCALGESIDPRSTDERVRELEERVQRIEELRFGQ